MRGANCTMPTFEPRVMPVSIIRATKFLASFQPAAVTLPLESSTKRICELPVALQRQPRVEAQAQLEAAWHESWLVYASQVKALAGALNAVVAKIPANRAPKGRTAGFDDTFDLLCFIARYGAGFDQETE